MKVGDLVKLKTIHLSQRAPRVGVMVDIIQKKVWRTQERGPQVDWRLVEPEPHGVVLYSDCTLNIPIEDLECA
jgi:hypothetical protein